MILKGRSELNISSSLFFTPDQAFTKGLNSFRASSKLLDPFPYNPELNGDDHCFIRQWEISLKRFGYSVSPRWLLGQVSPFGDPEIGWSADHVQEIASNLGIGCRRLNLSDDREYGVFVETMASRKNQTIALAVMIETETGELLDSPPVLDEHWISIHTVGAGPRGYRAAVADTTFTTDAINDDVFGYVDYDLRHLRTRLLNSYSQGGPWRAINAGTAIAAGAIWTGPEVFLLSPPKNSRISVLNR